MKKTIIAILSILAFSAVVFAHPPSDIIITCDLAASTVHADIMHDSSNILDHYLQVIEVYVNGRKMIKQETITQTDGEKQSVTYTVPGLKAGDKVAVDGQCSKYGELKKEVEVKAAAAAPSPTAKVKKKAKVK